MLMGQMGSIINGGQRSMSEAEIKGELWVRLLKSTKNLKYFPSKGLWRRPQLVVNFFMWNPFVMYILKLVYFFIGELVTGNNHIGRVLLVKFDEDFVWKE